MKRREFLGCAAALSLAQCQTASGQTEQPAATNAAQAQAGATKLGLTCATVDIAIVCSHFEESLRFYHEQLGLEIAVDMQIPDEVAQGAGLAPHGFRHVRLRAGNTLIKLMEITPPPARRSDRFAAGVRWLTFFVDNVRRTYAQLKADGVRFLTEPITAPDAAGVVCAVDPDGVLIEFVQV